MKGNGVVISDASQYGLVTWLSINYELQNTTEHYLFSKSTLEVLHQKFSLTSSILSETDPAFSVAAV